MRYSNYEPTDDPSAIIDGAVVPIEDAINDLALSAMPALACEKCGVADIVYGLWSDDGMAGHEIIVCERCWRSLTKGEEDGV